VDHIGGQQRLAVRLLTGASFFGGAGLGICDGLLPRLATDFNITTGTAGRAIFAFTCAYGVTQLVFGLLSERYGKARLICISLALCTLAAFASGSAGSFDELVMWRMLWGAAAAGLLPLSMAFIGDVVSYDTRQATLAKLLLGTLGGMTLGQFAGGQFAESEPGWRGAFQSLACGYGIFALLLLSRLGLLESMSPPTKGHVMRAVCQIPAVLQPRWTRIVLLGAMTEGIFLMGPLSFMPSYLHDRFDASLSAASGQIALFAVGGLLYASNAQTIVRRWSEARMVATGGLLVALGFTLWYASPVVWTAGLTALLVGFGTYLYHNTLQTHATQMAPTARGIAVSLFASSFFIGQAIGVSAAGIALDRFGPEALLMLPALGVLGTSWLFGYCLLRRATASG
jgi:predicted MFS family arabinose efflux permease